VYDLGAHHGFLSLLAGKLVGDEGHVYAFEPLPSNFEMLVGNVALNKVKNVKPIHLAISNKEGSVHFSNTIHDTANTYVSRSPGYSPLNYITVPCNSLDNLVSSGRLALPDFIKIDVEGAEYDVLLGATNLLKENNPLIYLETHEIHNPGVEKMCMEFLGKIGYTNRIQLESDIENKMASYLLKKG
ncbi:MAG TPA: FkbM family methyltransferase, partial [Chryseolinea sp.]